MGNLKIHLEYDDTKIDFEGSPEEVVKVLLNFLSQHYPAYQLIKNLTITVDLEDLLKKLEGVIGVSPEGVIVTIPKEKISNLSIREQIALHLVKTYIGNKLGVVERASLSAAELLNVIGGRMGAIAGRLSELVDDGLVERVGRAEYKITTYGLKQFSENILPKIRQVCGVA
ncbi:MAG: hypothetical protein DRO36_00930 [Candidatus Hecatellales archaeon]|nr:MAG: hypothetical protein DRO36_00930 [Candidatus Hecatellales archaeon]